MKKVLLLSLLYIFDYAYSKMPNHYSFSNLNLLSTNLPGNSIIDIREGNNGKLYFGTNNGLGYADLDNSIPIFHTIENQYIPRGRIRATYIYNNIIAVSGEIDTTFTYNGMYDDTTTYTHTEQKGTGISYSLDYGESWTFLQQPIDSIPMTGKYNQINWGTQDSILVYAVTTEVNNITYDIAINDDYIYTVSWAGGLRRYNYTSQNPKWEIIPLPMDNQGWLYCGEINIENYQINPMDPINGGSHNHKGFSVSTFEDTIWVGTAAGINKGVINGDCIDWVSHFTSSWHNISGNWVRGFHHQFIENYTRLWAITWKVFNPDEYYALSYTDDGGSAWHITNPLGEEYDKIYNIFSKNSLVFVSTNIGLYYTSDNMNWEKISSPFDDSDIEYSNAVSTSIMPIIDENSLWIGTNHGLARSYNWGYNWEEFIFIDGMLSAKKEVTPTSYSIKPAYPNPFNPITMIHYSIPVNENVNFTIYDIRGRQIQTIVDEYKTVGSYTVSWDASSYSSGIYLIKMNSGDFTQTQKVILVK